MTFLQIHSFYDKYLSEFYSRNPGLDRQAFEDQVNALVEDGFAAGHMFPPYLRKIGYDAHLIIANCPQLQLQWAREHGLGEVPPERWAVAVARKQVEFFKPEILYLSHPLDGFDSRFLHGLSWKPSLVIGWRAASIPSDTDWSRFDLMLSHLSSSRQQALRHGARQVAHFHPGFPKFLAEKSAGQTIDWDVVFSGQWTPEHANRNQFIGEIVRASSRSGRPFNLGLFLASPQPAALPKEMKTLNRGARWAIDMYRALRSGKICLNAEINLAHGEAGNMRLFEATGCGAFLLTEGHSNLAQYFEPGIEVETFQSSGELIEKIDYFLSHEDDRVAIAKRGQERCLRDYDMPKRAAELDALLRAQLKNKSITGSIPTPEPALEPSFTLKGSLAEIHNALRRDLPKYPRRQPGKLLIEGRPWIYADLHSFYHQVDQIFGRRLYDFTPGHDRPVIIDGGAHTGLASLYFAFKYPQARIHAFEADQKIALMLSENMQAFGLNQVTVRAEAIWVHRQGIHFDASGDDAGCIHANGRDKVPSVRLRDLLNHQTIDLLKLDIEGAEFEVLEDCDGALGNVKTMIVELHRLREDPARLGVLLRVLERNQFDYTLHDLQAAEWIEGPFQPPFHACKTNRFIVTVFAWQRQLSAEPKATLATSISQNALAVSDPEKNAIQVQSKDAGQGTSSDRALVVEGLTSLNGGSPAHALELFDAILSRRTDWVGVNLARAVALARLGHLEAAKSSLKLIPDKGCLGRKAKILLQEL